MCLWLQRKTDLIYNILGLFLMCTPEERLKLFMFAIMQLAIIDDDHEEREEE